MGSKRPEKGPVIGVTMDVDGEYLMLKRHYASAVTGSGGIPVFIPHVDDPRVAASIIDGLLIPGGGDIDPSYYSEERLLSAYNPAADRTVSKERTEFEIVLLKAIMELGKPVLGICYGMQLINVALGGSLYQDIGVQFGMTIDHRKGGHSISGSGDRLGGRFTVGSSHHQAVRQLGRGLSAIAFSDDELMEAFEMSGYLFLVGVQWHPERSDDVLSHHIFSSFVEAANARK